VSVVFFDELIHVIDVDQNVLIELLKTVSFLVSLSIVFPPETIVFKQLQPTSGVLQSS
jgi:hypothetical protein